MNVARNTSKCSNRIQANSSVQRMNVRTNNQLAEAIMSTVFFRSLITRLMAVATLVILAVASAPLAGSAAGDDAAAKLFPIVRRANSRTPADTSTIRGANYCYAEYGGHRGMWANYSPAITER